MPVEDVVVVDPQAVAAAAAAASAQLGGKDSGPDEEMFDECYSDLAEGHDAQLVPSELGWSVPKLRNFAGGSAAGAVPDPWSVAAASLPRKPGKSEGGKGKTVPRPSEVVKNFTKVEPLAAKGEVAKTVAVWEQKKDGGLDGVHLAAPALFAEPTAMGTERASSSAGNLPPSIPPEWSASLDAAVMAAVQASLPAACMAVGTQIQNAVTGQLAPIHSQLAQQKKKAEEQDKRIDVHDRRFSAVDAKLEGLVNDNRELRDRLDNVNRKIELDSAKPLVRDGAGFGGTRDPDEYDRSIIRVHAHALVGLEAVQAQANELAAEAGLRSDQYTVRGGTVAKNFRLEFNGTADVAARRVSKFLQILRTKDGDWRQLEVDRPNNHGKERIYYGADRSDNSAKKSTRTKQLDDILRRVLPGKTFQKNPRDAKITHAWQVVASLSGDLGSIVWEPFALELGIDTAAVDSQFGEFLRALPQRG
jgi:hypothetical protein